MQINVGSLDRIVRIVVGLVPLSLPVWLDPSWRRMGLIGFMPLIPGLAGRCPGYRMFGLTTCPVQRKQQAAIARGLVNRPSLILTDATTPRPSTVSATWP